MKFFRRTKHLAVSSSSSCNNSYQHCQQQQHQQHLRPLPSPCQTAQCCPPPPPQGDESCTFEPSESFSSRSSTTGITTSSSDAATPTKPTTPKRVRFVNDDHNKIVRTPYRNRRERKASWYSQHEICQFEEQAHQDAMTLLQTDTRAAALHLLYQVLAQGNAAAINSARDVCRIRFCEQAVLGLERYIVAPYNAKATEICLARIQRLQATAAAVAPNRSSWGSQQQHHQQQQRVAEEMARVSARLSSPGRLYAQYIGQSVASSIVGQNNTKQT